MDIASRIIEIREQKGYSTNKLAKISGLAQSTLRDIETGLKQPTIATLERIVSGLGLTLSEFFSCDPPAIPPEIRRLIDITKSLTPREREAIILMIETFKEGDSHEQ